VIDGAGLETGTICSGEWGKERGLGEKMAGGGTTDGIFAIFAIRLVL
jgi:hypothetical protein